MRLAAITAILAVTIGCGGGGPAAAEPELTAQQLIENCLVGDLQDLDAVLEVIQGFLDTGGDAPVPEFKIIPGILTGTFPWEIDLDQNGSFDLEGTVNLTDIGGDVVSAQAFGDLLKDLLGGGTPDLAAFLASLPDGTSINVTFDFPGLAQAGPSGSGDLSVTFAGGEISDIGGSGSFGSDDCALDVSFDDIPVGGLDPGGLGSAEVDFGLGSGRNALGGSIALDGSNVAVVTVDSTGQTLYVDLEQGTVSETPPT